MFMAHKSVATYAIAAGLILVINLTLNLTSFSGERGIRNKPFW